MKHLCLGPGLRACFSIILLTLAGCAAHPLVDMRVHTSEPKNIFVFMDGTGKDAYSLTNVRRLYEDISQNGGKNTVAIYVEGVGDARHPVRGKITGKGKDYRTRAIYAELLKIYVPGDRIYIFGFSRGAHTARGVAGLLSYAGIPELRSVPRTPEDYLGIAEGINERVKRHKDKDKQETWASYVRGKSRPPLAEEISEYLTETKKIQGTVVVNAVEIEFLGVWDTVPGSLERQYGPCIEKDIEGEGTKYKTNSYPTIKRIAHAVSNDDKRDRFGLLHVCKPISGATTVTEKVFPGAHSDVGGGYDDVPVEEGRYALSSISMVWMLDELSATGGYEVPKGIRDRYAGEADFKGAAHWSLSGLRNILVNDCKDRNFNEPPSTIDGAPVSVQWVFDESIEARTKASPVGIKEVGSKDPISKLPYPLSCEQYKALR